MRSHTYFITTQDEQYVKIGVTRDVNNRFANLNSSSPVHLKLIKSVNYNIERLLHKRFKKYNTKNEWFFYSEEIKTLIENLDQWVDFLKLEAMNSLDEKQLLFLECLMIADKREDDTAFLLEMEEVRRIAFRLKFSYPRCINMVESFKKVSMFSNQRYGTQFFINDLFTKQELYDYIAYTKTKQ